MLSGIVTIRNKKYPLAWSGQNAQHLAENYMSNPVSHPHLHIAAQQFARKGEKLYEGKRFISATRVAAEVVVVLLSLQRKAAVIHTCYVTNNTNFDNKKRKSVSGTAKAKKKKYRPSDFELSPETIAVSESHGVSEQSLKNVFAKLYNGEKPLNKKR